MIRKCECGKTFELNKPARGMNYYEGVCECGLKYNNENDKLFKLKTNHKWNYKIVRVIFNNKNNDEFLMNTKAKREFKTKEEFDKERKKLYNHGIKKYGEGTTVTLEFRER